MTDTPATAPAEAALQAAVAAYTDWQRSAALRIIATSSYELVGGDVYKVKSASRNRWYLTDPDQCTCPVGSHYPACGTDEPGLCKHRCAVVMLVTGRKTGIVPAPARLPVPDVTAARGWDMSDWPADEVTVSGVVAALEGCGSDEDRVQLVSADGAPLKFTGVTSTRKPDLVWVVVTAATGEDAQS